ncbi:MAG: hypothetical protein RIR06_338 [Bacteroidota bacterium]|jgi:hypothetical protein
MSKQDFILTDFSEILQDFNRVFPDPEMHEFESYGFLKLAQHGHAYAKIQALNKRGEFPTQTFPFQFKQFIKNVVRKKLKVKQLLREEALLLPKRVDFINGLPDSILVKKLLESELKNVQTWDIHQKFSFAHVQFQFQESWALKMDSNVKKIYRALVAWLRKIKAHVDSEDFPYYTGAAATFLHEFMFWNTVIAGSQLKKLYLVTHYHQEGLIAAARNAGVTVVELQHGLISKHDLYYVYDSKFEALYKKSFFPDELWCFGEYWIRKFKESADVKSMKIIAKGDFRWLTEEAEHAEKRNVILLATQKNMFSVYARLIMKLDELLKSYSDWSCEVKLHPLESNAQAYFQLNLSEKIKILPIETSIQHVLAYSKIQISIYSTTFYDALGRNVTNFAWADSGVSSDYVREVIDEGIAAPLAFDDDVIGKFLNSPPSTFVERREVFQDYI